MTINECEDFTDQTLERLVFVIGLSIVEFSGWQCGVWSVEYWWHNNYYHYYWSGHNGKVTSANKLFSQRSSNNKNRTKCFKISKISFRPTKQINWIRSSKSETRKWRNKYKIIITSLYLEIQYHNIPSNELRICLLPWLLIGGKQFSENNLFMNIVGMALVTLNLNIFDAK